jgi:hypothetical protein
VQREHVDLEVGENAAVPVGPREAPRFGSTASEPKERVTTPAHRDEVERILALTKGDSLFVTESPHGLTLTPTDPSLTEERSSEGVSSRASSATFDEVAK